MNLNDHIHIESNFIEPVLREFGKEQLELSLEPESTCHPHYVIVLMFLDILVPCALLCTVHNAIIHRHLFFQVAGLLVQDYSHNYSHWNAVKSLSDWLVEEKVFVPKPPLFSQASSCQRAPCFSLPFRVYQDKRFCIHGCVEPSHTNDSWIVQPHRNLSHRNL